MVHTTNRIREHTGVISESKGQEGALTRQTETITSHIPSLAFLSGAVVSMGLSVGLLVTGREKLSMFVGQWAPSFLLLGLYNKIVKVAGSD